MCFTRFYPQRTVITGHGFRQGNREGRRRRSSSRCDRDRCGSQANGNPDRSYKCGWSYRLVRLMPGTIKVSAVLDGFNTSVQENLLITAGLNLTLNFTLEQSSLTEEVIVTAAAPVVDVLSNTVTTTIKAEALRNLPSRVSNMHSVRAIDTRGRCVCIWRVFYRRQRTETPWPGRLKVCPSMLSPTILTV